MGWGEVRDGSMKAKKYWDGIGSRLRLYQGKMKMRTNSNGRYPV